MNDIRETIKSRGWSLSNLAWRWKISLEHLSRLLSDANRPQHWTDAVAGLPAITRKEAADIRRQRLAATADKRARRRVKLSCPDNPYRDYLSPGSVLIVCKPLGYADEGEECVVVAVRAMQGKEEYLIRCAGGEDWFGPGDIAEYLVETGKQVDVHGQLSSRISSS